MKTWTMMIYPIYKFKFNPINSNSWSVRFQDMLQAGHQANAIRWIDEKMIKILMMLKYQKLSSKNIKAWNKKQGCTFSLKIIGTSNVTLFVCNPSNRNINELHVRNWLSRVGFIFEIENLVQFPPLIWKPFFFLILLFWSSISFCFPL